MEEHKIQLYIDIILIPYSEDAIHFQPKTWLFILHLARIASPIWGFWVDNEKRKLALKNLSWLEKWLCALAWSDQFTLCNLLLQFIPPVEMVPLHPQMKFFYQKLKENMSYRLTKEKWTERHVDGTCPVCFSFIISKHIPLVPYLSTCPRCQKTQIINLNN